MATKSLLLGLLLCIPGENVDPTVDLNRPPSPVGPRCPVIKLREGETAPNFVGLDDQRQRWRSVDHFGGKIVVLFFFPADFKSGVSRQMVQLRDWADKWADLGVEIVGVSGDSIDTHALFKRHFLLNFTLLSDPDGKIADRYGVPRRPGGQRLLARDVNRTPIRDRVGDRVFVDRATTFRHRTFIVGRDGVIIYKNGRVCPRNESEQVRCFLEQRLDH